MGVPQIKSVYLAEDFGGLGFHDCYVHGIRWDASTYALVLDLDYIMQWVEHRGTFEFWVAPAELRFEYSSDVMISLDWTKLAMECQIEDIHKRESRDAPDGSEVFYWEIEFAVPHGSIGLWSADLTLKIQAAPRLLERQRLRGG